MNFTDVIKKTAVESFKYADISASRVIMTLGLTFAIAVYIFFIYRMITKSDFYFKNLNVQEKTFNPKE